MDGADAQTMAAVRSVCCLHLPITLPGLPKRLQAPRDSTPSCDDVEDRILRTENRNHRGNKGRFSDSKLIPLTDRCKCSWSLAPEKLLYQA
jgi:hypothetical protein